MGYLEKLNQPLWQKKRLEIFQRDNWKCTQCFAVEKELHVHHLDYIHDIKPWEYPNDMLITLCSDCHAKENERPKHESYLLQSLKMKGFLVNDMLILSCLIDTNEKFTNFLLKIMRANE